MTEPTEKETKWFVKRLIELRGEVNGYHKSFNFELKDTKQWEEESGLKLPPGELKDRVFHMLNEIKDHYIENNNNPLFAEKLKWSEPTGGIMMIEGYTTKMLAEYKNWLSLSNGARLALNIKPIEKIEPIKFITGGKKFELNINDGGFKYGRVQGKFGTKTQGFKILKCLVESRNSLVSYESIYSCLGLGNAPEKRRTIAGILKRVKHKMDILPEETASNPNIFRNVPNSGYEILEN
jgi:hypothetical protein